MRYAVENNITLVSYLPLVSGTLAGKYEENQTFNDHHAACRDFRPEVFGGNIRRVKELLSIAKTHNISIADIVLAFYLTRPSLGVVTPGAERADQIVESIEVINTELTEEEIKKIGTLSPIEQSIVNKSNNDSYAVYIGVGVFIISRSKKTGYIVSKQKKHINDVN